MLAGVTFERHSGCTTVVSHCVGFWVKSALVRVRREDDEWVLHSCIEAQTADAKVLDSRNLVEVVTKSDGTNLQVAGIEVTEC